MHAFFKYTLSFAALGALAGCSTDGGFSPSSGSVLSPVVKFTDGAPSSLDEKAELKADAPVLVVDRKPIRYHRHDVALKANRLTRVRVTAANPEAFDPLMECRPADGAPNEVVRCEDFSELGNGVQLDLLPERDGVWYLYVGDEQSRPGAYRIEVFPVRERRIFSASGEVSRALTGTEKPVTMFCQVQEGRRYRVRVSAKDFPPYALVGAPGAAAVRAPESGEVIFTAGRSGQAVLQVSSLSLASGAFSAEVAELWD